MSEAAGRDEDGTPSVQGCSLVRYKNMRKVVPAAPALQQRIIQNERCQRDERVLEEIDLKGF